ncbi:ribosomal RNA small subunit methyltransferase A [bacterium]|nr:MAG: ribosomal RNA small subunit methyltransferase A [bacterium]
MGPEALRRFLGRHGLKAEKALGQHFLASIRVIDAITEACSDLEGILEVGPGPGILTGPLSDSHPVTAIELDPRMPLLLRESAPTAKVVHGDALEADLGALLNDLPGPRGLVSNIPYYITGPLLERFSGVRHHYSKAVIMVQREVATRLTAKPGHADRGALSVLLQAEFTITVVTQAPSNCFVPPPKVDSTVLSLVPRAGSAEPIRPLVRLGFTQRRKTLANNLAGTYGGRDAMEDLLHELGIDVQARAQELSERDWLTLVKRLGPLPSGSERGSKE